MKTQGRLLPRAVDFSDNSNSTKSWDIMHIVQSLDDLKATRKQNFSFSHFKK